MKLIIFANEHFEEEKALFDLEENRVVLKGDYYHDKINEKIEGYLQALYEFNIYKEDVDEEWIDNTHDLYEAIDFYED